MQKKQKWSQAAKSEVTFFCTMPPAHYSSKNKWTSIVRKLVNDYCFKNVRSPSILVLKKVAAAIESGMEPFSLHQFFWVSPILLSFSVC